MKQKNINIRIGADKLKLFDQAIKTMPALNNRSALIRLFIDQTIKRPKEMFKKLLGDD